LGGILPKTLTKWDFSQLKLEDEQLRIQI